uniref:Transposable element P transposase-like RNase H domain-containing protein n=1 Tax=Strigamia maritima TaxID=126957 RepID=T1JC68_STRMM
MPPEFCDIIPKFKMIIKMMVKKSNCLKSKFGARGMRYSSEFLLECALLLIKFPKGYKHCLNHKLLPLPTTRTLHRLLRGLKCGFGINKNAILAIKQHFAAKLMNEQFGVLIFDEVKLRETVNYEKSSQSFSGFVDFGDFTPEESKTQLANHALVFLFVPLLEKWVQPVACFAARGATSGKILAKLIISLIIELESANAKVVGIVNDGSTSNKLAWKELGISGKVNSIKNKFPNPYDKKRSVFALGDYVHEWKCIRNHIEKTKNV